MLEIHPAAPERLLEPEQLHLLEPFANQLALALERTEPSVVSMSLPMAQEPQES
jgi:hypothetical protein